MVVTKSKGKLIKGNKKNTISASMYFQHLEGRSRHEFQVYIARMSQATSRKKERKTGRREVSQKSDG